MEPCNVAYDAEMNKSLIFKIVCPSDQGQPNINSINNHLDAEVIVTPFLLNYNS
jgi:hypothetical protein